MSTRLDGLGVPSGSVIQVVSNSTGSVVTGSGNMTEDDNIPTITQGYEVITVTITPKSLSNFLFISAVVSGSNTSAQRVNAAIFQDSTVNAIAAGAVYCGGLAYSIMIPVQHYFQVNTISPTTFRVRAAAMVAGVFTTNGYNGAREMGGVWRTGITIMEIAANKTFWPAVRRNNNVHTRYADDFAEPPPRREVVNLWQPARLHELGMAGHHRYAYSDGYV